MTDVLLAHTMQNKGKADFALKGSCGKQLNTNKIYTQQIKQKI